MASPKPKAQPSRPESPRRKRIILFYILANLLIVPVLVLFLLEMGLRIAGYGYPSHFFTKEVVDGKPCYVTNYKFAWRFFPKPMARLPAPQVIPAEKSADTIRVFVLGSSAAQGDPEPAFSFSRMLEVMLQERYPGKKIEVYNTAATAINSNVILPIARDCIDLKPDLFVIYSGNNEVIGPFGLSAVLSPFFSSRAAIKLRVWIGGTKIGQFVRSFSKDKTVSAQEWHGMELFLQNKIRHDDPDLQKIYDHFQGNISEICQLARNAGIKVVLSTVIPNDRDCAPFVSLHNPSLRGGNLDNWEALFRDGQEQEASEKWIDAVGTYTKATAIDGDYAELQFRLGRCLLRTGDTNKAAQCFIKARDFDALRFRADSQINTAIRKAASENPGVLLVDSEARARQTSPDGIPGASLLYEHVHLNFEGNYLLASSVLEPAEKALALANPKPMPGIENCKTKLAFTPYADKRVLENVQLRVKAPPFADRYSNTNEIKQVEDRIGALEKEAKANAQAIDTTYRDAVSARTNDCLLHIAYMDYLVHAERYADALREANAAYQLAPFEYMNPVNMGIVLLRLKKYQEAEDFLNQAIASNPYFTKAYETLESVYEEGKKFDKAIELLTQTQAGPERRAAFYNRAGITCSKDRQYDAAITYFKTALDIKPDYAEAQANLKNCIEQRDRGNSGAASKEVSDVFNQANQLLKSKQFAQAVELYEKVVADDPSFAKAHNNLGIALVNLKRNDDALKHFTEAIRLDPRMLEAYPNAAAIHGMNGRHAEAIELLKQAIDIKPSPQLYKFIGTEYMKMGNTNEARRWMDRTE